ncbi:MAG: hypothetical protein KJP07_23670 [Desulfatitalea sp.]|nr:hypothetical protein [Desulfatitalea sp.]
MAIRREDGSVQPGIKWAKFTTRIPGVHINFSMPEIIQGGLLATATAGVAASLHMKFFALPFEVAWAIALIQLIFLWAVPVLILGEPYAPGWVTPALPLILVFLGGFDPGLPAMHAMVALSVDVCLLFLFFGLTGLGKRFFQFVPVEIRAAIILGGALSAFNSEFDRLDTFPKTLPFVWVVIFILMFSAWFIFLKKKNMFLSQLSSWAMLAGFLMAAIVGPIFGELSFDIKMGFVVPAIGAYIKSVSPFTIGLPEAGLYAKAFPLALMVYIYVFGDLIVGSTLLEQAGKLRVDEKIEIDHSRSHLALFVRNAAHLVLAGPFIPLHGPLWTGGHVFLLERYKQGRQYLDSYFTGTMNFYWLALILVFFTPIVTFMKPLLGIALSITLILTGFACAYTAMGMVKNPISQGYTLFVGMLIAKYGPAWGLGIAVCLYVLILVDPTKIKEARQKKRKH